MLEPAFKAISLNKIMAKKLDPFVIEYLDDILIYDSKAGYIDSVW